MCCTIPLVFPTFLAQERCKLQLVKICHVCISLYMCDVSLTCAVFLTIWLYHEFSFLRVIVHYVHDQNRHPPLRILKTLMKCLYTVSLIEGRTTLNLHVNSLFVVCLLIILKTVILLRG